MLVSEQSGTTTRAASSRFFCQRSAAMEMVMILLVSAAAQLVSPASTPPPSVHLNSIIDLVSNKTSTLTKNTFVENVQELVEEGCKKAFFCKVKTVLEPHKKNGTVHQIVRELGIYINRLHFNCTEIMKNVTASKVKKSITNLLDNLVVCSRSRNMKGWSSSTKTPSRP